MDLGSRTAVELERTPDGRRFAVSRGIATDRDTCWDLLTDTRRWPEWGPSVRDVDCAERYVSSGTTGHVRTVGGVRLPFEITTCEDYRWTWTIGRIPATGHRVEGNRPCRIVFEVPPLAAGYVPVCGKALRRLASLADDPADSTS